MLCSNEITGVAYIVVVALLRSITNGMRKDVLVKNLLNGSCQFASLVTIVSIIDVAFFVRPQLIADNELLPVKGEPDKKFHL
jgi:hypothetical protein